MPNIRLMTVAQVATALNFSKPRIYELLRAGLLPSVRFGKQIRVEENELRAWITAGGKGLSTPGPGR
jgi:excisionase family DNA binding protein